VARSARAGGLPFGIGETKPHHYLEMAKIAWQNRSNLPYAWRILNKGVCDGCALGTSGLKDWTIEGPHLCLIRLNLLRLNTMGPLNPARLADVSQLQHLSNQQLHELGRLPYPMRRRKGEPGFTRVSWEEAEERIADQVWLTPPERQAYYVTARGTVNETYYMVQKAARFIGTNNVDNASRICHSPSSAAMKESLGIAAASCSYADWVGTDLLVFFGSNAANNQPVSTKYMLAAKEAGTQIVTVNPLQEPGMQRYWIPSDAESALFGTKLTDHFFHPHTGGDIAFVNGVLKHLIEMAAIDRAFIEAHTTGWAEFEAALAAQDWVLLERSAGLSRHEMHRFAELYAKAKSAVFIWSMGITQHAFGVQNVTAILNLALARGMIGRPYAGVMPIRGHSGVQGSAEVGCAPDLLPGGIKIGSPEQERLEELWSFPIPTGKGMTITRTIEAALAGQVDLLYTVGGNLIDTLPAPESVAAALRRIRLRVHQDIVLNRSMLLEGEEVILLPAATRYETPGGVTETSTERRIIFSPEIPGPRIAEARPEWQILMRIAERAFPERAHLIHQPDTAAIRAEIARANPAYAGIERLAKQGDAVQWGGRLLCQDGQFPRPDGRAQFVPVQPPEQTVPEGLFYLSTRRGKQFNSIIQAEQDGLTAGRRDHIFIAAADAAALGLAEGARVRVTSEWGSCDGRVKIVPIRARNLQMFWPEANRLLPPNQLDPIAAVPDYNAWVRLEPLP
jgi:molybdopterin-dependent oxidoreductase alpha subunit